MNDTRTYQLTTVSAMSYDAEHHLPAYSHQNELPDTPNLFVAVVVLSWPVLWPVCWL